LKEFDGIDGVRINYGIEIKHGVTISSLYHNYLSFIVYILRNLTGIISSDSATEIT
jgi:uncharacterized alkaline shock family protein YloU